VVELVAIRACPIEGVPETVIPLMALTVGVAVETDVTRPFASIVITGTCVEDPVVPAVATVARVNTDAPGPVAVPSPVKEVIPNPPLFGSQLAAELEVAVRM
jgi:hypothetical protein